MYTGLARMFGDFAVQCTWEGDNTVMALQTAKFLIKECNSGESALPYFDKHIAKKWSANGRGEFGGVRDVDLMMEAFRYLLSRKIKYNAKKLDLYQSKERDLLLSKDYGVPQTIVRKSLHKKRKSLYKKVRTVVQKMFTSSTTGTYFVFFFHLYIPL